MAALAGNGYDNELKNCMDCSRQVVSEGFVKLHTDLDKLRFKFETGIGAVKLSIKDIEESLCKLAAISWHFHGNLSPQNPHDFEHAQL